MKHIDYNDIAISFVSPTQLHSTGNRDQLESSFMYTELFKNVFLAINYDDESKAMFVVYCRDHFPADLSELGIVNELATTYRLSKSIWWYKCQCYLFPMVNQSVRCMEVDIIVNMSFFIRDLHQRLDRLDYEQLPSYRGKAFLVHQGQGLCTKEFQKIQRYHGGFVSFNNFLSSSTDPTVSDTFATISLGYPDPDTVTVLFVITIDPSMTTMPYTDIQAEGAMQDESEILFSMISVIRMVCIESILKKIEIH
jgi:hypothetical protein